MSTDYQRTDLLPTADLGLAAYLLSQNFELINIEPGPRAVFTFAAPLEAVLMYQNGGTVCAHRFLDSLRRLKGLAAMRGKQETGLPGGRRG